MTRPGGPSLTVGTEFKLVYEDESVTYPGSGSAGFVVRVEFIAGSIVGPLAGDVGNFVISHPKGGDSDEQLRGTDLNVGAFAVVNAEDFDYVKLSDDTTITFDIDITFADNWYRDGCGFGEYDEEAGFSPPTDECEAPSSEIESSSLVPNNISFYSPATFDFVTSKNDGGYLNYLGAGLSWYDDDKSFEFQIVGPKFTVGESRNTGALQAFLPEGYMLDVYGADFDPENPVWVPARIDVTEAGAVVQDLSNDVETSALRDGLLITLDEYLFSAPGFSFAGLTYENQTRFSASWPGFNTSEETADGSINQYPVTFGVDFLPDAQTFFSPPAFGDFEGFALSITLGSVFWNESDPFGSLFWDDGEQAEGLLFGEINNGQCEVIIFVDSPDQDDMFAPFSVQGVQDGTECGVGAFFSESVPYILFLIDTATLEDPLGLEDGDPLEVISAGANPTGNVRMIFPAGIFRQTSNDTLIQAVNYGSYQGAEFNTDDFVFLSNARFTTDLPGGGNTGGGTTGALAALTGPQLAATGAGSSGGLIGLSALVMGLGLALLAFRSRMFARVRTQAS
jgi:hypothetical protein